ncbi:MAG: hypothetical protein IPO63_16520 [Bacteroidetes bacterium]|nr:hypothetical protein [Bacteroidota bacterium]
MKKYPFNQNVNSKMVLVLFFISSLFFSCKKDGDSLHEIIAQTNKQVVKIAGRVVDENNTPLQFCTLKLGATTVTADVNGVFYFNDVTVDGTRAYVSATKNGYFTSGKGVIVKNGSAYSLEICLHKKITPYAINATSGGVVTTTNGCIIEFPSNCFENQSGQPFSGMVNVYVKYLSTDDDNFALQYPGGDMAFKSSNGELFSSTGFGITGVIIEDQLGGSLNLSAGAKATIKFPISSSQLGTAPISTLLMSYNDELGVWVEEGTATKISNYYVAEASHFSWWMPGMSATSFPTISGSVVDCNNVPISGAWVDLNGIYLVQTDANGAYTTPAYPGTYNMSVSYQLGSQLIISNVVSVTVPTGTTSNFPAPLITVPCPPYITCQAVDCAGLPIGAYAYASWGGSNTSVLYSATGYFQFVIPPGVNATVVVFNTSSTSYNAATAGPINSYTNIGNVTLCYSGTGGCGPLTTITDLDGNAYNVVTIGNQCWMAENLKTTKYNNGDIITSGLNNSNWSTATTGAWAAYNTSLQHDIIFGKLYNWYTVIDSRGVCPTGWHVPGEDDWNELTKFLDPTYDTNMTKVSLTAGLMIQDTSTKVSGSISIGWGSPNLPWYVSNLTGFTALPAGERIDYGTYQFINNYTWWWSVNDSAGAWPWSRRLYFALQKEARDPNNGVSVRCVKN